MEQGQQWVPLENTDSIIINNIDAEDPGEINIAVKAVNQNGMESEAIYTTGYVDSNVPELTGKERRVHLSCALLYEQFI